MSCVQRKINLFLGLVLVMFLAPLFLVVGLLILVFGGGLPLLFKQKRVGKEGKVFTLYKFRTMYPGADKDQKDYIKMNEAHGPVFKIRDDPRLTGIGKFLSHTGLDELPQLVNILKGEMNLVGPRPLPVNEAEQLETWQKKRENVKPGLISPWLFNGYHDSTFDEWMSLDINYVQKKSLIYDFKLILRGFKLAGGLVKREIRDLVLDKGR